MLRVTLLRYVVRREDDGLGGNGVDLYMGYLGSAPKPDPELASVRRPENPVHSMFGSSVIGMAGNDGPKPPAPVTPHVAPRLPTYVHGTTQVRGGLTNSNGSRGVHDVAEQMFDLDGIGEKPLLVKLNLIEADETMPLIKKAYNDARTPSFSEWTPNTAVSANDAASFFLVPFAGVGKLFQGANTDDDYGDWTLDVHRQGGAIRVLVVRSGDTSLSRPQDITLQPGGSADLTLQYLDGDNDIDAVLRLESLSR